MKIAVIGIGAVGSVIAREMMMLPHDITLFGRSRKEGFTIQEDGERRHYPYTIEDISAYEGDAFDIIFIATKATALKSISGIIPAMAHRDTEVILCENGMGFDEYFDAPVPAVVYISGQKREDRIEHFQDARLLIGDRPLPYTDRIIDDLENTTGVELEIKKTEDFRRIRYEKLLINLGINSLTALSSNTAKIFDLENVTDLTRRLLREGLDIINRKGEIIDPSFIDKALSIYQSYNREMGTSMYYDVMAEARTEYMYIQKYFQQHKGDLDTPVLDIIVTLLDAYQYER